MARTNRKTKADEVFTHEGGKAVAGLKPIEQLKRSVMACFLWEDTFYEDGVSIADRIRAAAVKCAPEEVAMLAVTARSVHNLRHAPLLLLDVLTRTGAGKPGLVSGAIENTIQRADELAEFMSIYVGKREWKDWSLSGQTKKGLAAAFRKFDAYQIGKYDRGGKFRLRDVLFLSHAKPLNDEQKAVWEKLIANTLESPDTWEVALSGGADKKETFERLLKEGKLGYMAVLRNLRNMAEAGCDVGLVNTAIRARKGAQRVLPFRYVAAVNAAPQFAKALGEAMLAGLEGMPDLGGRTVVCIDTSGSMSSPLSAKSQMKRVDAAATLASMVKGDVRLIQFGSTAKEIPFYRGLAGIDAIRSREGHCGHGTNIGEAVTLANSLKPDRLILITDEQSHDNVPAPTAGKAYTINTATYQNGIGYRNGWIHIDGFSEGVIKYIHASEAERAS